MSKPSVLLVCMGVSGSGKSTVARILARQFELEFCEGDDFHSPENKARMAAGEPLSDALREPWIDRLSAALAAMRSEGRSCVLAWSALRRAHRQRIRALGFRTLFLHLQADPGVIAGRLDTRPGHFFHPGLLHSQFLDLQPTADEPDVVAIDMGPGLPTVVAASVDAVRTFLQRTA
ncbi:MAG: gluconokinase [Lysobacterales bacterium]